MPQDKVTTELATIVQSAIAHPERHFISIKSVPDANFIATYGPGAESMIEVVIPQTVRDRMYLVLDEIASH